MHFHLSSISVCEERKGGSKEYERKETKGVTRKRKRVDDLI
jgi:hypothetical protein